MRLGYRRHGDYVPGGFWARNAASARVKPLHTSPCPPAADFGRNGRTRRADLQNLASPSWQKCEKGDINPGTTVWEVRTLLRKHVGVLER